LKKWGTRRYNRLKNEEKEKFMAEFKTEQDYEYFCSMWEDKKLGEKTHKPEIWNDKAKDWGKELEDDGSFRHTMQDRVQKAVEFLSEYDVLGAENEIVDIGCGPGRFVAEFAKTAKHVTGIDISDKMLRLGEDYVKECGLDNVTFMKENFCSLDIQALGWEKKFDLVFTSITPAIGTMEGLKKSMQICRKYCFNSCFVRWNDELENDICKDIYGWEKRSSKNRHGKYFYALFNLLWLDGYFPETRYHCQNQEERVDIDDKLIDYYTKACSKDKTITPEYRKKVATYLEQCVDADGKLFRKYERWYGWILWDVRKRVLRA
jgi:SAM-dependent methyltransferase